MFRRSWKRILPALAAAAVLASTAAAHERWVRHALLRPFDRTLFDTLCWANALTALGIAVSILWLAQHSRDAPRPVMRARQWLSALSPWSPTVLRICYGLTLVLFALRGLYLAPDLRAVATPESRLLVGAEAVAGSLLLAGCWTRAAALLSLFVYAWALWRRPFEPYEGRAIAFLDVLSYAEVVGIGLYLLVARSGRLGLDHWRASHVELGRARDLALALQRVALGVTLVLLGLVKFLIPELFMGVVQNYPAVFHEPFEQLFGASEEEVVFGASALEITLGLYLICGLYPRVASFLLGTVFVTTAILFREEVLGHLPLVGMVLVLVLEGGGSLRWPGTGAIEPAAERRTARPALARAGALVVMGAALGTGLASFRLSYAANRVWEAALGGQNLTGTYQGHRGRCAATVAIVPPGVGLNRFFAIQTTLHDAQSQEPLENVDVVLDVTMPQHGHGMPTRPRTRRIGPGTFLTEGCKLHMFGDWVIQIEVERGGEEWDRLAARYDFQPAP